MKKLMLAISISLLFAPLAYAAADSKATNTMPPFGKEKTIPAPKITKKTLANGLEIWVLPRKGLPRVDYVLAIRGAGFVADDAAHPGMATMLASLLNEGTAKRDSRAVAETAQGLGGVVGGTAGVDGLSVIANASASNAAAMMSLLAEVARQPAFPAKEVQLAKENALEALKAQEAQPGFRAGRAIAKIVYGDHPYGNTNASAESITTTTEALLRAEHVKRFRPDRSLLVITGRITAAEALKLAQAAFGDWKASGPAPVDPPPPPSTSKPARVLLERPGSVQSTIRLGAAGVSASVEDHVPLKLASTIIGGGFSSRVNMNLREEKGYTYGASAGARSQRLGGSINGGADVRNEVTGASLKEFFSEYKKLGSELVPASEMQMNKRYVAGEYLIQNQLQSAVAMTLAGNGVVGLPSEFLGKFVPAIQKVSPEKVREMGKKYFSPEAQAIVVVGDKAAIAEQLKAYGDFTVSDK
jgi:zinc protease